MIAFWKLGIELSISDDLVLFGSRIKIPKKDRNEMLKRLHESHQGIYRTKRPARQIIFWPGIRAYIENTTERCENKTCATARRSRHSVDTSRYKKMEHDGNNHWSSRKKLPYRTAKRKSILAEPSPHPEEIYRMMTVKHSEMQSNTMLLTNDGQSVNSENRVIFDDVLMG